MGFRSLQHSRVRRSTAAGFASARYVPPSGFGYPLGGLLPPSPCRPCLVPAALLGFALRSFLLPEGIRRVSAGMNPRTVSPVGNPAAGAVGRPNGPRFLGFDPSGSPWRRAGVNSPTAGCSLGLHPPRAIQQEPCPGFRPDSSHALRKPARRPAAGAPEYRGYWFRDPALPLTVFSAVRFFHDGPRRPR
jgi:hypothetical protein